MIIGFGNRETEQIWFGNTVRSLPLKMQEVARRKLRMINNAQSLADLRIPPANQLEKLKGNLSSYFSIRINDQWRIIFKWIDNNAVAVTIIDYHK
jgi:proteic killer suppression protein